MTAIISDRLIDFVVQQEGLRTVAYRDAGKGVWTIGVGCIEHDGRPVRAGERCTVAQARTWLAADLQTAAQAVDRLANVILTEGQRDALISFTFNLGAGTLGHSTLLKLVNEGRFNEASLQFSAFDHAGGKVVEGLVNRRHAERMLFLS